MRCSRPLQPAAESRVGRLITELLMTMNKKKPFRMPRPVKITARSSSITNSFVNSIIPVVPPSSEEVQEALSLLGMSDSDVRCAYCGDKATEWDHLRAIVRNKRPTGYISEIANLVPACGKCNQSKSGMAWRLWIAGGAPQSPGSRGIADLQQRIMRLEAFERWRAPTKVDWEQLVPAELWKEHWENLERVHELMRECQQVADQVRVAAATGVDAQQYAAADVLTHAAEL